jgi:uncharacterized protein YciI
MSSVSHYLYKLQTTRPEMLAQGATPDEAAVVSRHFAYLERLTGEGVVVLAGRTLNTDATAFGLVILRADSEEAARNLMLDDPAVKHDVMRAELYPYRIALMATP